MSLIFPSIAPRRDESDDGVNADSIELSELYEPSSDDENPDKEES